MTAPEDPKPLYSADARRTRASKKQRGQANELEIENGVLTGRVVEPILDKEAKLQALRR